MADPAGSLELPDPETHIPYRVLSQQQRQDLTPDNRFVDLWDISYEGPSGVVGKVQVPQSEHDPASIDRAIQTQLHTLESVAALGPAPHPENLAS